MAAAAVTLAALFALVVALLAVPVVLAIDAERVERLQTRWQVQWLFGLVRTGSRKSGSDTATAADRARPSRAASAPPAAKKGRGPRVAMAILRTRGLVQRAVRFASDLQRQVTVERFYLHTAFGFDNPADTGIMYGLLSPFLVMAGARGLDVSCRPVFQDAEVTGILHATVRIRPLSVAATVIRFAVSRPVRRAAVAAWRAT